MVALDDWLVHDDGFVPKARYISAEFAQVEADRLWKRVWQIACREEEIARPGDFLEYQIVGQSIIVVRRTDGSIGAFHNACLHRGRRLAEGIGHRDECFTCPYHAWQYALDGRLVHVVDRDDFGDAPLEGLQLAPVSAESYGGFVFVNLDTDAEPLRDFLAPLHAVVDKYHLECMRFRSYLSAVLPANWKVVVDAFNEGYHVQGTHPQILPWTDDVSIAYEQLGGGHAHYGRLPHARRKLQPSPRLGLQPGDYDEGAILQGMVRALGGAFLGEEKALVDELLTTRPPDMLAEFQARRRGLLTQRGLDVSGLDDDELTSADDVYWFPNLVGPIYPGSAILFRVRPNGLDPDSCIKDTWVLEWPTTDGAERRPLQRKLFANWRDREWDPVTTQDYENMGPVQAGMKSDGYQGLRLNPRQESNLLGMHRAIDRYLT